MTQTLFSALRRVANAMAEEGQPEPALGALQEAFADMVGYKLFTILTYDRSARVARRAFSSMPEAYPVGGTKPIVETDWVRQVLRDGKTYVGHERDDIRHVFTDYELIWSLGCESIINVPVRWDGDVIGTCNLLHQRRWYSGRNQDELMTLAQFAVPILQGMR
jgi:transcriptional regulator with GAF, ATPase, and Fis domain